MVGCVKHLFSLAALVAALLLLCGCLAALATNDLQELNENPEGYDGKTVTVEGNITSTERISELTRRVVRRSGAMEFEEFDLYNLTDGGYSILVAEPREGLGVSFASVAHARVSGVLLKTEACICRNKPEWGVSAFDCGGNNGTMTRSLHCNDDRCLCENNKTVYYIEPTTITQVKRKG